LSARRYAFGLVIESEIDLPELPLAAVGEAADVEIRLVRLPPADRPSLHLRDGEVFLRIRDVAHFRFRAGREIAVDVAPGASPREVRAFLLGSAIGVLCHQRGLLPLHASAIVAAGRAIAFAGPSGAGKSTLAAHFQSRGQQSLCDDVCVVSFGADGRPLAWSAASHAKLWGDSLRQLGREAATLERARPDENKYLLPALAQHAGAAPLDRVYLLGAAATPGLEVRRLAGLAAARAVLANVYRAEFAQVMGLSTQVFALATALARQTGVFTATRARRFGAFTADAAALEAHFAERPAALEGAAP